MHHDTRCSVFLAASVDGFIARANGDVSWLQRPEYSASPPPGLSYDEFIATVDCVVMGRHTFDKVLTLGAWPYEGTPVLVLTSNSLEVPVHLTDKVSTGSGAPLEIVSGLASEGKRHLYVDGGITIQRFLKAGLIDELTITRIPVLLGGGIPLFGTMDKALHLEHIATSIGANGFVQDRYRRLS